MAVDNEVHHQNLALLNPNKLVVRHGIPLRRRKLPSVRLGGKKPRRRVVALMRILRRMKLRWLKLQYMRMMRKLKEYYRNLVKDLAAAGASLETFQQRVFLESSFAVPVMGVSFSTYPNSVPGSDRPRTVVKDNEVESSEMYSCVPPQLERLIQENPSFGKKLPRNEKIRSRCCFFILY